MSDGYDIRPAAEADLPAVVTIYNESIPGGWSTADLVRWRLDAARLAWFREFAPDRRPLWVAVASGGGVAGWAGLKSFYGGRPAYDATAEVSFYVGGEHQRRGLGARLLAHAIAECPRPGVTTLLAMHFDHNEATRKLCARFGFERFGHLPEIADVGGAKRGLVIAGLRVPERGA